jgi:DNA-binding SARP family transcriptional activator/tetratricopeptide (TPR) repeat protein
MAPFFLKTLGLPELHAPDGKVVRFRVKKHLALLVYLAVDRRRAHERHRLVELFWPRLTPAQGRHSFATALSFLRSIFGRTAFPTSRPALRFSPANLVVDVERLDAGAIFGEDGQPDLDVDGFLRGFELDDAPEFGLWKEREHARRLPAIHGGLLSLIDHGRRRGSHDEIMTRADRLLAIDHLAEEGIRARMEAFALIGDRFSALRVFDEWREELSRELGAEPSMFLEGMAAQLRKSGWAPKESNPRPAVPAEQWRDRRFVGRVAEFRRLYEAWEAVHQGRPRHVLITGDSGIGKTTLAQRLVTAAGLEGASVSRVQCFQLEQKIPFAAIGGLIAGLLGRPGVAATSPDALAEIARIVPQVKAQFSNLPAAKQSEGEAARLLFAEAAIDFLKAVMDERPLLLVIDDYHHADEASLAVWHYVWRRLHLGRVMLLTAITPGREFNQISLSGPMTGDENIALGPMTTAESRELLTAIFSLEHVGPNEPESRALVAMSAGIPMALELLCRDWLTNRSGCLALSFKAMTEDYAPRIGSALGCYTQLIERVLSELSAPARRLVEIASIIGPRLHEWEWPAQFGLSEIETTQAIAALLDRRLLRDVGSGLDFVNEIARAVTYRGIPQLTRHSIHEAVAKRLSANHDSQSAGDHLELAWHFIRSHQREAATPHLLAGARQAVTRGAPDEAILAITSGFESLLSSDPTPAGLLLAEAHAELGRWYDCLSALSTYCRGADGQIVEHAIPLEFEARMALQLIDSNDCSQAVDRLLKLRRTGISTVIPEAFFVAVRLAAQLRDYRELQRLINVTFPMPTLAARERAMVLTGQAMALFHLGNGYDGRSCAAQAAALLGEIGAQDRLASQIRLGIGAIAMHNAEYEAATVHTLEALEIAERLGHPSLIRLGVGNAALCLCRVGRYADSIAMSKRLASLSNDPWSAGALTSSLYARCLSLAQLGRFGDCLVEWERGIAAIDGHWPEWLRQATCLYRADLLWMMGKRKQALLTAAKAVSGQWDSPLSRNSWGAFARWISKAENVPQAIRSARLEALVARRHEADALDRLEILLACRTNGRMTPADGSIAERDGLLGMLPKATLQQLKDVGAF